jgi:hypothetical protein
MDIKTLSKETILAINLRSLSTDQIGWLSQDQIGWLSRYQIGGLSRYQIGGLSQDQIGGLSQDQIGGLSRYQIGWLSQDQIDWLSKENQVILFGADVPKVKHLYSKMLTDINNSKRYLDQHTFGPDSAPTNICNTPMCLAGHTINLAGAKGYKLKDRFSFEIAARLIHRASCPDFPEPRYDSYPNEWALSYITEMAKLETE